MENEIKVWTHDPQAAEAALLAGEETEDVLTQYGASELLHVGQLAKADKVIKDAKLMMDLGFTFTETERPGPEAKG